MSKHQKFSFQNANELRAAAEQLGFPLPWRNDAAALTAPISIHGRNLPNRMAVNPMEGCDGTPEGAPAELTFRRYERFARGGAGLLWVEATAVVPEGRANPRQLHLNNATVGQFARLAEQARAAAADQFGSSHKPLLIVQLTHSGRYSKPTGKAAPIVAALNPHLDRLSSQEIKVITDEELEALEEKYVAAALLAAQAGFDGIDLKCCHGYLVADLLSAHTREGKYGGSFENRTRFLCNVAGKVQEAVGNQLLLAARMNAYDSVPYPYGWGVNQDDFHCPDYTEPRRLAALLTAAGVRLINVTVGNPYFNPHVNRPYDIGGYVPPFHPLENTEIILNAAREIKEAAPAAAIVGTGFSWLRQFGANVAAGCVEDGWCDIAGFGRQAFAYPDFAGDILATGKMEAGKTCFACSKCTCIMRDGGTTGCVPRDAAVYGPIYLSGRKDKPPFESVALQEHV